MKETKVGAEWTRMLKVEDIELGGVDRAIEADGAERRRLSERFGLLDIVELKAELHVRRLVESSVIAVEGKFSAGVVQECVVTLEPLEARIKGTIAERFAPVGDARTEFVLADEDEDLEEPLEGDSIDLGEIVAQSLSLALDPYPRKHGAAFEPVAEESDSEPPGGPFAALATLNESDG